MDSSMFAFAGLAAAGTTLAACWRSVKNLVQQGRAALVVDTAVASMETVGLTLAYLHKHGRQLTYQHPTTFLTTWSVGNGGSAARCLMRTTYVPGSKTIWLINGQIVWCEFTSVMRLRLTAVRWGNSPSELVRRAVREYLAGNISAGTNYYHMRRSGTAGKVEMMNFGGGKSQRLAEGAGSSGGPFERPPSADTSHDWPMMNAEWLAAYGLLERWDGEKWGMANSFDAVSLERKMAFHGFALTPETSEVCNEFAAWLHAKTFYQARGLAWRRGLGLVGAPGNGKTSLVRALAKYYQIPIVSIDLVTMRDTELTEVWETLPQPCIVLMEDIDCVFNGRAHVDPQAGTASFGTLLNCLDGISERAGQFLVVTTNNPDALDAALRRPGRLDRMVEVPAPTPEGYATIAQRVLDGWPDLIAQAVADGPKGSAAGFSAHCQQLAEQRFWQEAHTLPNPPICLDPIHRLP